MKSILSISLLTLILTLMNGCASHANYPVTWQNGNVDWHVLDLSAEFEHENFNLFNRESKIIIKSKIDVTSKRDRFYEIDRLFIKRYVVTEAIEKVSSIRINPRWGSTFDNKKYLNKAKKAGKEKIEFSVVEIIPLFNLETGKKNNNTYDISINEPIRNRSFGRNYYRIIIGDKQIDLGTFNGK